MINFHTCTDDELRSYWASTSACQAVFKHVAFFLWWWGRLTIEEACKEAGK